MDNTFPTRHEQTTFQTDSHLSLFFYLGAGGAGLASSLRGRYKICSKCCKSVICIRRYCYSVSLSIVKFAGIWLVMVYSGLIWSGLALRHSFIIYSQNRKIKGMHPTILKEGIRKICSKWTPSEINHGFKRREKDR